MAHKHENKIAGIYIGGNADISTGGGSIAGGNMNINTTIQNGFAAENQKTEFQAQIEQLREALRAIKTEIEASPSLSDDQKEEAASEILQHVKALKEVKEKTAEIPAGKPAPVDVGELVETTLDRAGGLMDRLQSLAKTTGEVAGKVGEFGRKYGPLILSARHLFGLS